MNCEQVSVVLDTYPPKGLTPPLNQAVERHLESCCECRVAWAAYRELAAEEVPPAARDLRARVAAAIAARAPRRSIPLRRTLVIGAVMLAGAAAASFAVRFASAPVPAELPVVTAVPVAEGPAADAAGDPAPVELASDSPQPQSAAEHPLDPYSIVVLPLPRAGVDEEGAAAFAQCHADVVRELTAGSGLNPIAGDRVAPYAGSTAPPEEIARALGAGSVLVLTMADASMIERIVTTRASVGLASRVGSCVAQQIDATTGEVRVEERSIRPDWQPEQWRDFAANVVERVIAASLVDPAAVLAEARAKVLDPMLDDVDRAVALVQLRRGAEYSEPIALSTEPMPRPLVQLANSVEPVGAAFDDAVVAAIVQIGSAATVVRARETAWRYARGVRHPQLVEALTTSLARDPHQNVRRAAALALGYLVDEPGVRAALERAAEQDPNDQDPIPCCVPSVRGAALRALSSDEAIRAAALATVLDSALAPEDRLRPLTDSLDGRAFPLELDAAAAEAVFAMGSGSRDPLLRSRAWNGLRDVRNEAFVAALLDDLAAHPADDVRAAAAGALQPYVGDAAVLIALEQARQDPALAVRRAAQAALTATRE